jgi:hypothetical protein
MNADINGALEQLNKSYKAFTHNGKPMTKEQVRKALQYGKDMGLKHTGEIPESVIEQIFKN